MQTDLLIDDCDITLDDGRNPKLLHEQAVIAQDIKHAIIESGLAVKLVAERSQTVIDDVERQIILLCEQDMRVVPGTAELTRDSGQIMLTARTRAGEFATWI